MYIVSLKHIHERVVTVCHNITDDGKTSKFGEHSVKYAAYVFVYA